MIVQAWKRFRPVNLEDEDDHNQDDKQKKTEEEKQILKPRT